MGLWDEAWKAAQNLGGIARDGLAEVNATIERTRAARQMDAFLEKAAADAARGGRDGNHDPDRPPEPKALHFDPFELVAAMGYRERPSSLGYGAMERVGRSVPVVADVVKTRATQVATFCKPPEDRFSPGFELRLRDRDDTPSKGSEKRIAELTKMVLNTGWAPEDSPHDGLGLATFARMFMEDSLIFDQGCFEVVPDRKGDPAYISIVDASTIRLIDPGVRSAGDPFAVQVINGSIVADFTPDELAFCVRNPRSGVKSYGYGVSEIETLVREITGFLWGIRYNMQFFSQGSAAKGILNFKGTLPEKHLQAFRRQWYAMVSGVNNAFRTPITNAEELQWINLQLTNRDMEYSHWIDFLIKIVCARYQIATEEVGFSYGNTGQSQAMGQAPIEEKLKASRDLGLRPLVYWFFEQLNRFWLQRVDPDFEMVPTGLDAKSAEAEADLLKNQTSVFMTIDEAREQVGMEPLGPESGGDAILNPTWLQYVQGKQQAAQQATGMGGPDDGGDFQAEPDASPDRFDRSDEDLSNDFQVEPGEEPAGGLAPTPSPGVAKSDGRPGRLVVDL